MEKFILMGASRGLGWETYLKLREARPESRFLLSSRKILARAAEVTSGTELLEQDFSRAPVSPDYLARLREFAPTTLIYFAGGGPYGSFAEKKWAAHQWALQTSFLYPAELLHHILGHPAEWKALQTVVLIGSSVAESAPDPGAASYAAAKHALKGLVSTVQKEAALGPATAAPARQMPRVLLFSPGYMQTDLLPPHSEPRLSHRAENPAVVAERLIEYIENSRR